jgi:hypothetical protein
LPHDFTSARRSCSGDRVGAAGAAAGSAAAGAAVDDDAAEGDGAAAEAGAGAAFGATVAAAAASGVAIAVCGTGGSLEHATTPHAARTTAQTRARTAEAERLQKAIMEDEPAL